MNCDDCRQRLQDRLDGQPVSDGAAVRAHLASCPRCRALYAAAGRLEAGLRLLTSLPPPELRERIVRRVLARRQKVRRLGRLLIGLAVAASLLVLIFAAPRRPRPDQVVQVEPAPPAREAPPATPSLQENMAEATTAVASLTRRTADETVGQGRMLLDAVTPLAPSDAVLLQPLEPPTRSLSDAGQGVASSLQPVTSSARRAVNLFLRDLAPMPQDKPGL